jgi:hypothetical protein
MRGLAKVRGEWSLMALCYNFSRVLRILGLERWLAVLAALLLVVYQLACSLMRSRHCGRRNPYRLLQLAPLPLAAPS